MTRQSTRRAAVALLGVTLWGCAGLRRGAQSTAAQSTSTQNTAQNTTPSVAPAEWRPMFAGGSLAAWRGYRTDSVPSGWSVSGETLTKTVGTRDLVSRDQYGDFDLEWEWKLDKGGNAGVFYRGTEEYDHIYWSGTEYQLLDDANAPDGRSRLTAAGAVYGLYPVPEGVVKPAGEWNASRIVARGAHVEHWLNGRKVGEYDAGSPDWTARVKASKFARWPNYGRARRGYIGIQGDHPGDLTIRNMRIRAL